MRNSASLDSTAKMKKTKRYTALGIFGLFAFFFALMYGLVIYLLHSHHFDEIVLIPFPPREAEYKNGALADGIEATEETFKAADGSILHGWYFHKPGNKLTVLFHHGNAANIAYRVFIASELMKTDIDVFLYDYRGFGKSTGTPEVKALSSDGLMAYDHLTNQLHVAPTSIINYGESIGTGVACHIASQRPSAGLILQSAIGSLPKMAHHHFNFVKSVPLLVLIPDFLLPDPKLDNIEEIKKVHVPVILLHGDLDTTAPPEHAKLIFANANEPKKLVCLPHSSHNDISQDAELFATSLKDFFNKTTVPADWTPTPSERVEHKEKLK